MCPAQRTLGRVRSQESWLTAASDGVGANSLEVPLTAACWGDVWLPRHSTLTGGVQDEQTSRSDPPSDHGRQMSSHGQAMAGHPHYYSQTHWGFQRQNNPGDDLQPMPSDINWPIYLRAAEREKRGKGPEGGLQEAAAPSIDYPQTDWLVLPSPSYLSLALFFICLRLFGM